MSSTSPPPRPLPPKKPPSQNPNSLLRVNSVQVPLQQPPLPPRSPDIRPTDTSNHSSPHIPPRSPDLSASHPLSHSPSSQQHTSSSPSSSSNHQPTLPPRQNSNNNLHSQSKLSFEDISTRVHSNNNQPHHPSSTISSSSPTTTNKVVVTADIRHSTFKKPLPPPPPHSVVADHSSDHLSRLSLKTPPTSSPHPPLPPRSGSALSLATPNSSSSPLPRPNQMGGKDKPNNNHNNSNNVENHHNTSTTNNISSSSTTTTTTSIVKEKQDIRESTQFVIVPPSDSPISSHPSLDHLASFTGTRDLKAKEILTTERTYCDNMKILVEVFIEPLKVGEGGISKDAATIICSNLPDILLVSIELLKSLEERLAHWSPTQKIGDVLLSLIPFLKMYTNYTVGFDNALVTVTDCEKNSSFVSFIQRCTEDPRTKKLDLRSYLIQPVQRITRYHMLLDELLKHTEQSHPDYIDLQASLTKMKAVTNEANEAIKLSENRAKVMEIQKMFVTDPDIVAAHRSFVFEGVLTKVCRKACKKRIVFLFSDLLVYGSSMPPKLLLHEKISLDHCRIEDIPDGDSGGSRAILLNGSSIVNAFQICSNKKSFVVFADTPEMKMQWLLKLTQTIELLQEKRSTLKSENKLVSGEAPVWVPDETTTNCPLCEESFTLLNRRHHCRNCGTLVCGKCSDKKFKLPITDFKPARVCNQCYEKLARNPPATK